MAAPVRFFSAALWPLTIWSSLTHFEEHPADDYVERTSPIVATAIGFWLCVAALGAAIFFAMGRVVVFGEGADAVVRRLTPAWAEPAQTALLIITTALYVAGLWLFAARAAAYRR